MYSWKASYVQHLSLFKRLCNGEYFDLGKIEQRTQAFNFSLPGLKSPEVHYFPDRTLKQAYLPIPYQPNQYQPFIPFCVETFSSDLYGKVRPSPRPLCEK
jgi:hypothetical protein